MNNEQLPAFLRRRNGRLELVLHCTWGQDYDICPQKFWLRYGVQVEGTGPKVALNYGGAVHEAKRIRYSQLNKSLAQIEEEQMAAMVKWFDEKPQPTDEWRNAGRAQDLIRAYNVEYPVHDWEVLAVEEEFEMEVGEVRVPAAMTDPDRIFDSVKGAWVYASNQPETKELSPAFTVPIYLAGRKDLVVAWHDGLWVVDHKTSTEWGKGDSNSAMDEGRMSFQFRGYAWAEREWNCTSNTHTLPDADGRRPDSLRRTLPILGTVGNYLISRKPFATERGASKSTAPRNEFHQVAYPFDAATLDEWRTECLAMAADILRNWQAGEWRRHRGSCGHWGRCEFYDYCEASPEQREELLASSLFQPKVIERDL